MIRFFSQSSTGLPSNEAIERTIAAAYGRWMPYLLGLLTFTHEDFVWATCRNRDVMEYIGMQRLEPDAVRQALVNVSQQQTWLEKGASLA
ncbi:hypothetical protein ACRYI5_01275 [Furfurilactobacillus sp. WILCCON 0119]